MPKDASTVPGVDLTNPTPAQGPPAGNNRPCLLRLPGWRDSWPARHLLRHIVAPVKDVELRHCVYFLASVVVAQMLEHQGATVERQAERIADLEAELCLANARAKAYQERALRLWMRRKEASR